MGYILDVSQTMGYPKPLICRLSAGLLCRKPWSYWVRYWENKLLPGHQTIHYLQPKKPTWKIICQGIWQNIPTFWWTLHQLLDIQRLHSPRRSPHRPNHSAVQIPHVWQFDGSVPLTAPNKYWCIISIFFHCGKTNNKPTAWGIYGSIGVGLLLGLPHETSHYSSVFRTSYQHSPIRIHQPFWDDSPQRSLWGCIYLLHPHCELIALW